MPLFPTIFPSKDEFAPTQPILPNLSPSEELHVLLARIAELTRATQVGSSVASSEVFGQDDRNVENTVEFLMDEEAQEQQEHRRTPTMEASSEQNFLKTLMERIEQMAKANAEQLANVHNDIMEKIGKWEKQQEAYLNFRMSFPTVCPWHSVGQQQEDRRSAPVETSANQNTPNDVKKMLERIEELEKQHEKMAKANAEQLAKIMEISKWSKQQQQQEKEQKEKEQKEKEQREREQKEKEQREKEQREKEQKEKEQKEKEQREREQKEKEQRKKEKKEKTLSKLRMNFWDPLACHGDIEIIGSDRLTVRNKGNDWHSVFAANPITLNKTTKGIFYFEISIKFRTKWGFSLGVGHKQLDKLATSIRGSSGTYAWDSDGQFWIDGSEKGPNGKYSFRVGDVVGIGVNLANRQMFFTKNGLRLDSSDHFVDSSSVVVDDLFPFVILWSLCNEIEANFGPGFKFDLANL